jgi:UDP-glucose 4-epimerase
VTADAAARTALVIGGRGFIGSRLATFLVESGHRIVCLEPSATTLGRLEPLADHVSLVNGSAADREALAELVEWLAPSCVVNLAYARGVDIATEMDVMARGLWNTFDAARLAGCHRVVFASSVRVYGPQSAHGIDTVLDETSPCHPVTRYGLAKLLGERLAADFDEAHGMEISALRIPMVYGPGVLEGALGVCIPAVAAGRGEPASLPYDPDARLCLAHVDEAGRALAILADSDLPAPRHIVYELGGVEVSYAEMVRTAQSLVPGVEVSFIETDDHPERLFAWRLDGSRLRDEFGIDHRALAEGYERIVEWARASPRRSTTGGTA